MKHHPILFSILIIFLVFVFFISLLMALVLYFSGSQGPFLSMGDMAVLKIEGAIYDSEPTLKEIVRLKEEDAIKAVVVRIDSPGGAVAPSQEIFEELKKLREKKKVVVSMGTVAASGGYYIASVAHKILASPGTITGSIGVIMESLGFQELLKKISLESRVIKTGDYKDVGSPLRRMEPSEREYLEKILVNMYDRFLKDVSQMRGMEIEKLRTLAQGKIYTGEQALEVGLIDGLGTLYDAIEEAKKLAGLPKDAKVIWPREEGLPWMGILSSVKKTLQQVDFPLGLYLLKN